MSSITSAIELTTFPFACDIMETWRTWNWNVCSHFVNVLQRLNFRVFPWLIFLLEELWGKKKKNVVNGNIFKHVLFCSMGTTYLTDKMLYLFLFHTPEGLNTQCLMLLLWYLDNSVFAWLWDELQVNSLLRTEYQREPSVSFIRSLMHIIVSCLNLQTNSSQSAWKFKYHLCTYIRK